MIFFLIFIISFVIYFLVDYIILKHSKKLQINEFKYLKKRFKYSKKFEETNKIKVTCSLLNALIMSVVCTVMVYCNFKVYISLPLAFVLLILLIYSVYGIYGNILKKVDENEKNK